MTVIDTPTAPDLVLSAPVNLRDLGGIHVPGGTVRQGFALRADDLAIVTTDDAHRLVTDGLRAVIDLRSADEVELTGRGPLGTHPGVTYHHVPLMVSIGQAAGAPDVDPGDLIDQSRFGPLYLRIYEGAAEQIVMALAIIAYAPGTVAFHCAAGQDRTGVLAASLLLALGADREGIIADYARTGENSTAIMARIAPLMAPLMQRLGFDLDEAARAAVRSEFSDAPMRELFAALTARHGDPLGPLRGAGLTDHLVARLRQRAVDGPANDVPAA
ncbi:tyrosine-protein phosphatase [Oerskovia flava]|uniref:tyrosine-protein phosphatase n=1 Tax=Oerskovia flava TaxID=2986422 RepID=UPI00223EA37E|nr:tyrosine-protein phosphatase [Oerskovia sp. JB1-3-2]